MVNYSCSRKVTFFDAFAQYVAKQLMDKCEEGNISIVIIASAKVNKYAGNIISNIALYF